MPSVTFHPVCPPSNKRKDGTWPVKIRVTFKGRHRYLATTLVARPGDLSRSLSIKSPDITRRAAELIGRMQDTLRDLSPFDLEAMDVDGIVAHIRGKMLAQSFRLDLFAFADTLLAGKHPSTRRVYDSALNALAEYLGDRRLDINAVTHRLLLGWMEWTDGRNKRGTRKAHGAGTATRHAARLAHIYRAAQAKYNDDDRVLIPRNPFAGLPRATQSPEGQRNLGAELMQRIVDDREADRTRSHFGSEDYSREELVAEMGAAMLCSHSGIDDASTFRNSVAYLQNWISALKNDNKMIVWAASRAEKAARYIIGGPEAIKTAESAA